VLNLAAENAAARIMDRNRTLLSFWRPSQIARPKRRAQLQKQVGNDDAYLASFNMTIAFQPFDAQKALSYTTSLVFGVRRGFLGL
jgi:hypothetical protein